MYTVTPGSEQIRATIERDEIVSSIFIIYFVDRIFNEKARFLLQLQYLLNVLTVLQYDADYMYHSNNNNNNIFYLYTVKLKLLQLMGLC